MGSARSWRPPGAVAGQEGALLCTVRGTVWASQSRVGPARQHSLATTQHRSRSLCCDLQSTCCNCYDSLHRNHLRMRWHFPETTFYHQSREVHGLAAWLVAATLSRMGHVLSAVGALNSIERAWHDGPDAVGHLEPGRLLSRTRFREGTRPVATLLPAAKREKPHPTPRGLLGGNSGSRKALAIGSPSVVFCSPPGSNDTGFVLSTAAHFSRLPRPTRHCLSPAS